MDGMVVFRLPGSNEREYCAYLETPNGGVVQHHGSIRAERALEFITPAKVTLGFFARTIDALIHQHGDRAGTNLERVRDFLARAEEAFVALPRPEPGLASAGSMFDGGLVCLNQVRASEAAATKPHDEGVTMATRKKTVKKAAKPRSAKKKSAGKKAAKKSPRKRAT